MTPKKFSKGEAVRFGWDTMKRHLRFFVLIYLVYGAIFFIPRFVMNLVRPEAGLQFVFMFAIQITVGLLALIAALGFIRVGLKFCDNEEARIGDLFSASFSQVVKYFVATFLTGAIVSIGYVPLVIIGVAFLMKVRILPQNLWFVGLAPLLTLFTLPFVVLGIIWSVRLSLYPYFIVDQGKGPIAALKSSWAVTKDSTWNLFLFGLLLGFLTFLGALAFVVGLLAVVPTTVVAHAFVYRKLQSGVGGALSPAPA